VIINCRYCKVRKKF